MKYTNEVVINLPLKKVIELFDSEENLFKWQPELISFEHLSGEKGEVGAKSKLRYTMGKREIEMIETITVKNLPKEFSATYEAKDVWNEMKNYFEEICLSQILVSNIFVRRMSSIIFVIKLSSTFRQKCLSNTVWS